MKTTKAWILAALLALSCAASAQWGGSWTTGRDGSGSMTAGDATNINGLVLGNGSTIDAYGGSSCTNQFVRSINASGVATCASVATADIASPGSGAEQTISYQPGLLTAVNSTIGVLTKFTKTSTVDNIVGSAITFSCAVNPTITLYECGTTATCDSTPTTIGSVTLTGSGTAIDGTINAATITATHYVAWSMTAGTCASIDLSVTAQVHAN